jgi:hypothetical protein
MGHNSLLGIDEAPTEAPGHGIESLGPSDSSDTGSDMTGLGELDAGDHMMPVDVAMGDDAPRTWMPVDAPGGASADASGTGERRSAGNDAGAPDGADIGVDRIIDPAHERDDEDPDLGFIDDVLADAAAPDGLADDEDPDALLEPGDRPDAESTGLATPRDAPRKPAAE